MKSFIFKFYLLSISRIFTIYVVIILCSLFDITNGLIELNNWKEDRYIKCIFCIDYDDRQRLSIYGCGLSRPPTCYGNLCYMRQHKSEYYYLYTSGCLNLTLDEFDLITSRTNSRKPERGNNGNETQLCEVTHQINACICANRNACNNMSSGEPFSEYAVNLLSGITFDELAHFKHFAPNDPVLEQLNDYRPGGKILINYSSSINYYTIIILTLIISIICSTF